MNDLIIGNASTRTVFIGGVRLDEKKSQKVYNHSPDGFNWGYRGSGPAQLALAVMLELTDQDDTALRLYQKFKAEVVANLNQDEDFELEVDDVKEWIKKERGTV